MHLDQAEFMLGIPQHDRVFYSRVPSEIAVPYTWPWAGCMCLWAADHHSCQ